MNKPCVNIPRAIRGTLASAVAFTAATAVASLNIEGDSHSHRFANGGKTVISFVENGSFTVTGAGTVELLAVGGGGGGGSTNNTPLVAGGGGAGGLVHKAAFSVSSGTYTVAIGAGGAVGANGGNTVVSGNGTTVTAYGGGAGADGNTSTPGAAGGSGGGGATAVQNQLQSGGAAAYSAEDNLGNAGTGAIWFRGCGGGGGAGYSPTKRNCNGVEYAFTLDANVKPEGYTFNDTYWLAYPSCGGDGLAFDITGESVYYAGGGAAARLDGDNNAQGGLGGGGGYMNGVGSAGTDGLGGGGAGGFRGGSGVVIISFTPQVEATDDFALSGGNSVAVTAGGIVHTFTQSGTLSVSGSGTVELLAVGGGGGGGSTNNALLVAGGGGAGGLVHIASVPVSAGSYSITIGAGGAVGANGGDTLALGVIAYGGGAGADGNTSTHGAAGGSGGGGATATQNELHAGGAAAYAAEGNIGNAGAGAIWIRGCGGGGGAGSSPTKRNCNGVDYAFNLDTSVKPDGYTPSDSYWLAYPSWGGDGLAFDITGESVYYAGGGAAARIDGNNNAQGGLGGGGGYMNGVGSAGTDGLGGGGAGGFRGGSGVVILRYVPAHSKAFAARGGAISMDGEYRVHTFSSSGTFTMPCNGLVDILLVGGGGGGGAIDSQFKNAAGGGAGGLVYITNVVLAAGAHTVAIGSGGAIGANGGDTSISADIAGITKTFTAYGGGAGADGNTSTPGAAGGSGGGAAVAYANHGSLVSGGAAAYSAEDNLGNAGTGAIWFRGCGGGGGAGSSPTKRNCNGVDYAFNLDTSVKPDGYTPSDSYWLAYPSWGGDGLAIGITGESVYYAGGGAAARLDGNNNAQGGLGGGGGYMNTVGSAGTDGLGGGGAGGFRGGSGVVIIRYRFAPSCTVLSIR